MGSNILFILEGPKTENNIANNLTKFFVNENIVVTCAYCTTIYKMYTEISKDEDLDTFSIVKEIDENKSTLKEYKRTDFAQIYMFFDYDGHNTNASDAKLEKLLLFFNEETEKGKLYISYPMVEALKHIERYETFKDLTSKCKKFNKKNEYKKTVNKKCVNILIDFNSYNLEIWKMLIDMHLKKMNKLVNSVYEFPMSIIDQLTIFKKQLEKHINRDKTVAVLSAFPIFLHDYYGNSELKKRLK